MKASALSACPCGSGQSYPACCQALHQGAQASSAEAVMRARYSAYALGLEDYVRASWHPSTRPAALNLAADQAGLRWIGLQVKRHEALGENEAMVEFVARYKIGGRAHRMHESSRFLRVDDNWFYVGPIPAAGTQASRDEPLTQRA